MSAYRTPGTGETVSCQRCAKIVKRKETEYASDGSLRCRPCLRADVGGDLQADWTHRKGFVIGLSWMLAACLTSLIGLDFRITRDSIAWLPFAATTALGVVLIGHQLASGRRQFSFGLALGALVALVPAAALVWLRLGPVKL